VMVMTEKKNDVVRCCTFFWSRNQSVLPPATGSIQSALSASLLPLPINETRTKATTSCQLERTPRISSSPSTMACKCKGQPWSSMLCLRALSAACLHARLSGLRAGALCVPLRVGVVTRLSVEVILRHFHRCRYRSSPL
jgi:hypothetical protein